MARKRGSGAAEGPAPEAPPGAPADGSHLETPASETTLATPSEPQSYAPIQAPPKGEGRTYTIDDRLGYRKEDSADGRKRQIRFADREGGQRPDDETLAAVREQKPEVSWSARDKAWQARKTPEGLQALDAADQKLAELGRKRTGGQDR